MKNTHRNNRSILKTRFFFWLLIFLFLGPFLVHAETLAPVSAQENQCVRIINALEKNHFLDKRLDNSMSSQIFDLYIKRLDPSRSLLTRSDLNRFEIHRYRLDNDLVIGNLDPAFEIYNLYQSRAEQRLETILDLIKDWKTKIVLDSEREIIIESEDRPLMEKPEDLKKLWEDDLINHIITLKLDGNEDQKISETLEKIYASRLSRISQTNASDVFQLFMNSVAASFDPHTQYFPPRASEDFDIHMSLSLEGIGAVLQNEYEYTKVVRLIPKGPADESNLLMPGDKIIGVGQGKDGEIKDTIGQRIDKVVEQIRGPKNTYVRLKIIPAKKADSTATIAIKRDRVKLEEQSAQKKVVTLEQDNKAYRIGIIEIPNFYIDFSAYHRGEKNYKSTTTDVKNLLFELKEENIDGLIMDLRDNGGGSLKEANDLTGLFLKTGPTVQIKTKHRITRLYDEDKSIEYTGPLLVLINRMSASASEIFAGAIKDYNRGIVVGTRSFGKGTVQELKAIGEGKLKLTSAKFYRVSGESTQHRGVEPDIHFPQIYKIENTGESSLDGALPWDTIIRTAYRPYPPLNPLFSVLEYRYRDRSSHTPGMIYLKKRIEMTQTLGSQDRISLNLEKRNRKRAVDEATELQIENEYLEALGQKPLTALGDHDLKINDYKDILMEQTQFMMADFISLARDKGYEWQ